MLTFPGVGAELLNPGANPANYQAVAPVPIGWIANIQTSGPGGDYVATSDSWSGGTSYSAYTSASPPPPTSVSLLQNVVTNASNYQFIVDSNPRQYTITVNVTYSNHATGAATLTFTSDAPTGSLKTQQLGMVTAHFVPPPTNYLFAGITPDLEISATSTVDANTGGSFMFLQIANTVDIANPTSNAVPTFIANSAAFDDGIFDGPLLDSGTLAYPYTYTNAGGQTIRGNFSWTLPNSNGNLTNPAGGATAPFMADDPHAQSSVGALSFSISESFSDYLMYMSSKPSSVWVAISQMNWSWSVTVTPTNVPPAEQQSAPTGPTKPGGVMAFPTWINTTSNLLAAGYEADG